MYGHYNGDGTNSRFLSTGIIPSVIFITGRHGDGNYTVYPTIMITTSMTSAISTFETGDNGFEFTYISWSTRSVSWEGTSARWAANQDNGTYYWVALGT